MANLQTPPIWPGGIDIMEKKCHVMLLTASRIGHFSLQDRPIYLERKREQSSPFVGRAHHRLASHVGISRYNSSTNLLRGSTTSHPASRAALRVAASTCEP